MVDKLLIRAYKVGVGDCIYVRIPKARTKDGMVDDFHILIDCGKKHGAAPLKVALDHLKSELPLENGSRRLDLVLISHEHEDHIKGFDPNWFADVRIENLWMSVAMDRTHPQAHAARELHDMATRAMRSMEARNLALSPELRDMVERYSINNVGAMNALLQGLPAQNNITPLFVHADTPADDLRPPTLSGAVFKVLGPDRNIDKFYLGDEAAEILHGFSASTGALAGARAATTAAASVPANIGVGDFRRLKSRMLSGAFAFTNEDDKVINNTSVMLVIEWQGRRLLFVGDAEWSRAFAEGRKNGAWNVAWALRNAELNQPVDFLKIGHHGSENATPWREVAGDGASEPGTILDAILPLPVPGASPRAKAIVSTERSNTYKSIPRSALLREIGRRVSSTRNYASALGTAQSEQLPNYETYEEPFLDGSQPLRTDLETILSGDGFVEVTIEPAN